jgi:hypothetical protein
MKNTQNITIVLLAVSATILAGLWVGTIGLDRSAQAGNTAISGGDYIMVPYTWSDQLDLMVVVDVAGRKMNVYFPNKTTKALDPIQPTVDLERTFAD